jgi:putative transposase
MNQMARNVTMEWCGALGDGRYLLHDRDTKCTASFLAIMKSGHVKTLRLPARSPNLNAFSERWIRSVKEECLSKVILFGENSSRRAMSEYVAHYHTERNHQGKSNIVLFPRATERVVTDLSNVVRGWVDYYVTTTETPRELAIMSRRPAVRL